MKFVSIYRRCCSAFVMVLLAYLLLFQMSPVFFAVTVSCLFFGLAVEWSRLCGCKSVIYSGLYALSVLVVMFTLPKNMNHNLFIYGCLAWGCALSILVSYVKKNKKIRVHISWGHALGWFILLASCKALFLLHDQHLKVLVFLIALVISVDIGAYFMGCYFGKDPFLQSISPSKTIQGVWGGCLLACVVLAVAAFFLMPLLSFFTMTGITLLTIVTAIVGDLFVSVLKRLAGVKDSGTLIPGHGGLLDRFDSLLATLPFAGCFLL
jgi:phosphatidate cytidylyltransferase